LTTVWTLDKLERVLVQVADRLNEGSDVVPDDFFYDPNDDWEEDNFVNLPSGTPLRRSRGSFVNDSPEGFRLHEVHRNVQQEARARRQSSMEAVPETPGTGRRRNLSMDSNGEASVTFLCREYIRNSAACLGSSQGQPKTSADELVECLSALRKAAETLYLELSATPSPGGPSGGAMYEDTFFVEKGSVRNACLSASISIELLCSTIKLLARSSSASAISDIIDSLHEGAASAAENAANLLTGIEKRLRPMVKTHYEGICDDIKILSMAAGEMAIATHADAGEDEEDSALFTGDNDLEEFVDDEADAVMSSSSRMIALNNIQTNEGINQDILEAFERGTQKHVENAFERLTQDMDEASAAALGQSLGISDESEVNKDIVEAVATVAKSSRDTFICAADLQASLIKEASENKDGFSKQTFYRKSFARAKGIINEVTDVADSVTSLSRSCSSAVSGNENVEQLMAHAGTLRAALARLVAGTETKLSIDSLAHQQLNNALKAACSDLTKNSKELSKQCEQYNASDAAYAKRETMRQAMAPSSASRLGARSFSTPLRKNLNHLGLSRAASPSPQSEVQRRMMLMEQQTLVHKLEQELLDAQRGVKNLHKAGYEQGEATSDI